MPWPVRMMTGVSGELACSRRTSSRPSAPGIRRSESTTSTGALREQRDRVRHRGRGAHGVEALRAQDRDQRVANVGLVLDHQHAAAARCASLMLTRPPRRAASSGRRRRRPPAPATVSSPPCWRTIEWQIESPRPVESLVEKNGSKIRSRSASATPGPRSANSATAWPSRRGGSGCAPRPRAAALRRRSGSGYRHLPEHDRAAAHQQRPVGEVEAEGDVARTPCAMRTNSSVSRRICVQVHGASAAPWPGRSGPAPGARPRPRGRGLPGRGRDARAAVVGVAPLRAPRARGSASWPSPRAGC